MTKQFKSMTREVKRLNGHHLMGIDFPVKESKKSPIKSSVRSYKKLVGY